MGRQARRHDVDRMPCSATARAPGRGHGPGLAAAQCAWPGCASQPSTDALLTTAPPWPCATSWRSAALVQLMSLMVRTYISLCVLAGDYLILFASKTGVERQQRECLTMLMNPWYRLFLS
jgi:hypothetical protein